MTAHAYVVADGIAKRTDRGEATTALAAPGFVWLHFDQCDVGTTDWLTIDGGLPELVVAALVATETRPRLEAIDGGALVNLRGPDASADNPDLLASVRLWVAKGRVFSVARRDLAALAVIEREVVAGRVRDPGDFVATLAGAITAGLDPDVAALGDQVDDAEEAIAGRNPLALRQAITGARSRAIAYRRFVAPQRVALERLAELQVDWLDEGDRLHLNEAADRAARMAEELEAIRERSALLHEQLTDLRAETIDTRSLILAIAAMIFLPVTFITGLFGMNVDGIPYQHHPWSFWVITGFCLAVAGGITGYFVWRRWSR